MSIRFLLFLFLIATPSLSQQKNIDLLDDVSIISSQKELSVHEAISYFKDSIYKKEKLTHVYKKLGNKNWWFLFNINKSKQEKYLTLSFPYLSYGKIFLNKNDTIIPLYKTSYYKDFAYKNVFYRHPTWIIPSDSLNNTQTLLEVKNGGARTRLEFHLETKNEFLKRTQLEYLQFGFFLAFLIAMVIILLYFSLLKKEYNVLFYAAYILCMTIEFLAGKGLGIQLIWSEHSFLSMNIRSISQTIAVFCMGYFYMSFYNFSKDEKISKNIFKWTSVLPLILLTFYVYKYFFGGIKNLYLYVWVILKIIILIWFFNHLFLLKKKRIPAYLVVAFSLPILSIIISQMTNPRYTDSIWYKYGAANIFYIALIIEILLFTRYIFNSVIQSQKKYSELKKISNELKYNFQNKTLEIQEQERNKLLNNVHDTFGGYLEALKLRLFNNNQNNSEKVKEILDAFYEEYRYLLNSLYSPKINSENFIENLIEFIEKINSFASNNINHNFSLKNTKLSSEKCVHIYRIISELTTNAIKYSEASEISINIFKEKKPFIILKVFDNGIGFDKNNLKAKKSYGLNSIKNRVENINGEIIIESEKNKGTKITIKIPEND